MTARDSVLVAHPLDSQQPILPAPRRRRTSSSTTTTTTTTSRPLTSKRSPSPIITFSPTPLSSEAKGVKNITRKVIKTLEGLGHLESIEMEEPPEGGGGGGGGESQHNNSNGHQCDHETTLGDHRSSRHSRSLTYVNGSSSSNNAVCSSKTTSPTRTLAKVDWEIPRKLLHSSIGFITLYLYVTDGNVKSITIILWTALSVIVPADILRLRSPTFERVYERCLGFLMRESEKKSSNGVIWYILGVNFALTFYPLDVATVAILILSWADTAASTFGRLFGSRTPPLPPRVPLLRLPLAPRKSLAGFIAASITGCCIAAGFWGWVAPVRNQISWSWQGGAFETSSAPHLIGSGSGGGSSSGGWSGLAAVSLVAGLVSGVSEALDLGSLDDNLTLPIISGGCILGFLKLFGLLSSA